jgi:hypothetical protein
MLRAFELYTEADNASHVLRDTIDLNGSTHIVAVHFKETSSHSLSPVIGCDKASKMARYAMASGLTLQAAALKLSLATKAESYNDVNPNNMMRPYVAIDRAMAAAAERQHWRRCEHASLRDGRA